ncbi:MAG: hypothetical protein WC497_05210 [Patescibacteria group bacterium]
MHRERQPEPIQGDLFPESAEAKHGENIERVVEVDRRRPSAVISVEGYEITFVLWKGKIEVAATQGALSVDEIPEACFAAAKRRATGILRSIEAERKQQKVDPPETQK